MERKATSYFLELAGTLMTLRASDPGGGELPIDEAVTRAVELMLGARAGGGKAMVVGNGGSAAIAAHLHNDLTKAVGLRSLVFHEPSLLTALANDHGYEAVYEAHVRQWAEPGDLLIAISSSGQSVNILRSVTAALERGALVVTMTGFSADNPLRKTGHLNFYAAAAAYGPVELAHSVLGHVLTDFAMAAVAELAGSQETQHGQPTADGAGHRWGGVRRRRASA